MPTGSAAERELVHAGQRLRQHGACFCEHGVPRADFLSEGQRGRILQMGSSGFDDIRVFLFQPRERVRELIERREQAVFDGLYGRDVHRGREGVIAALRLIDMVVRMHELFCREFHSRDWR